jgi:DNA-binding CsgD family transcriptional regulator
MTRPALSPRQRQILRLVANGSTAKEIADKCALKLPTVKFHLKAIKLRLRAITNEHAVYIFFCR